MRGSTRSNDDTYYSVPPGSWPWAGVVPIMYFGYGTEPIIQATPDMGHTINQTKILDDHRPINVLVGVSSSLMVRKLKIVTNIPFSAARSSTITTRDISHKKTVMVLTVEQPTMALFALVDRTLSVHASYTLQNPMRSNGNH